MADTISITRFFAAPVEIVFALWTKPELFATWFGTDAIEVPLETLSYNAVVGNEWTAVMRLPDGSTKDWAGDFVEIDAPRLFVMTLTDEVDNPERATVTARFEPVDGGTSMTMTQAGSPMTAEQIVGLTAGYNAFFDTMETMVTAS